MADKVTLEEMVDFVEQHRTGWHFACLDSGEPCEFCSRDGDVFEVIRAALLRLKGYEERAREIADKCGKESGTLTTDLEIWGDCEDLIRDIAEGR